MNEAGLQRAEEGHFTDAIALWGEASRTGCAKSHYNLAVCYENGNGCKRDLKEVRNLRVSHCQNRTHITFWCFSKVN